MDCIIYGIEAKIAFYLQCMPSRILSLYSLFGRADDNLKLLIKKYFLLRPAREGASTKAGFWQIRVEVAMPI